MDTSSPSGSTRQDSGSQSADLKTEQQRFLESVSHSLRTPLTAVLGFAESLQSDTGELDEQERSDLVATIAQQAVVMSYIVEDYLVGAQAELGVLSVARVPINLRAQLAQVVERSRSYNPTALQIQGEATALGDPGYVRQIIRNLLLGAELSGGSRVLVRLSDHQGPALLAVIQDGSTACIEDQTRDRGPHGLLGVGLPVARKLAQLMCGKLTHRQGSSHSVYTLSLPAHRADDEADQG